MSAPEAERELEAGGWHRLHPLSLLVRTGRASIAILLVIIPPLLFGRHEFYPLAFIGVVVVTSAVSWLVTRWRVTEGALRIETGLFRRQSLRVPLHQIQAIDTVRPGLARLFGVAELRLRMAGRASTARLAYLPEQQANELRAKLLAISRGQAEDTPEPPERVLALVPVPRLVGSIVLSPTGLFLGAGIAALATALIVSPGALAAAVSGGFFVYIIGFGQALWRRFNSGYGVTVAEAPDGLRLRSGLVQTAAETIPRRRVQAVRLTEPLLWRPLGWVHLSIDVAGRQHRHGENPAESRQLRQLLPVGTREQARELLAQILPEAPTELSQAPRRALLKTPLRYHWAAWGHDGVLAVTTSGRVTKATDWIPLSKVQSLRWVQGPTQRPLTLATIHLDTAGRNVHAAIRDRDGAEAGEILVRLTELSRRARARERSGSAEEVA
jgi:putative membrane protein